MTVFALRAGRKTAVLALAMLLSAGTRSPADEGAEDNPSPVPYFSYNLAPKEEFLLAAKNLRMTSNVMHGTRQLRMVGDALKQPNIPPPMRVIVYSHLALNQLRLGEIDKAIKTAGEGVSAAGTDASLAEARRQILRARAICHLRQAEQQNCIEGHCSQSCIFPVQRGGVHLRKDAAKKCKADLEAFLAIKDDDDEAKEAMWLLNVVNMTLGTYPEGVPSKYLLEPKLFESQYDIGRFSDVAPELGCNPLSLAGSALCEDFDGDGVLEILTTTSQLEGPCSYFKNDGTGKYTNLAGKLGLEDQIGGFVGQGADYDNDGDLDVSLCRGGWFLVEGRIRNSLLRRNQDGTFTDVTRIANLAEPAFPTQTATWADYDNDGDLDVFVGNESLIELVGAKGSPGYNFASQLFRNNGDGTFTDVAIPAGVANDRFCKGAAAGDFDNDGDIDLFVSNYGFDEPSFGRNRLYRNNGDGTFTDIAEPMGVLEPFRSFATWFFDYDNDGWLDLFVCAFGSQLWDAYDAYKGNPFKAESSKVYHNEQGKGFRDVSKEMGMNFPHTAMGASFGDLDNDGYLDVYLTTGNPYLQSLVPNMMYRNDRGKRWQDITTSGGFGHLQKGHGVCFADVDNDGDQDVYSQLGGAFPVDQYTSALYLNPGHGNRHLKIKLVGVQSNRQAVGARVKVVVDGPEGPREIHRAQGSVSSFGWTPTRMEIGLGAAASIREVEVWWPKSNTRQTFANVPLDSMIEIREGDEAFRSIELPRIPAEDLVRKIRQEREDVEALADLGPSKPGEAGAAKSAPKPDASSNASDGGLLVLRDWVLETEGETRAALAPAKESKDGRRVEIQKLDGDDAWQLRLLAMGLPVKGGAEHTLRFKARADKPRSIVLGVAKEGDPIENLGLFEEAQLAQEWKAFEYRFKANKDEAYARLHLNLGQDPSAVELAEVSFDSPLPPSPPKPKGGSSTRPEPSIAAAEKKPAGPGPEQREPSKEPVEPAPEWFLGAKGEQKVELAPLPAPAFGYRLSFPGVTVDKPWDVHFDSPRIAVKAKARYTMSFRARSEQARPMIVQLGQKHEPWQSLGLYQTVALTPEWQSFSFPFEATADDELAHLQFLVGESVAPIEIADISLDRGEYSFVVRGGAEAQSIQPIGLAGLLRVSVSKPGQNPYDVQLLRSLASIKEGVEYELTFKGRAERPARILCTVTQSREPWGNLGLNQEVELAGDWRPVRLNFKGTGDESPAGLILNFGLVQGSVEIKDLKLSPIAATAKR